jgi:GNAT superfamily N-acetyltransferase
MEHPAGAAAEIRPMRKEDIPELAELYRQFWDETSNTAAMERQLAAMERDGAYVLLCAHAGDSLVGSVTGIICRDLYGDCRPFMVVENMVVDRQFRRSGVGGALLKRLEETARDRHCSQMILVTEKSRQDACAFYEASGFSKSHAGYKKKL